MIISAAAVAIVLLKKHYVDCSGLMVSWDVSVFLVNAAVIATPEGVPLFP